VNLDSNSVLFVFPDSHREAAQRLATTLRDGYKAYPGFQAMFRVPFKNEQITSLAITADLSSAAAAAMAYRTQIAEWNTKRTDPDPQLALVLVPHSERWETDRPYYEAKAAFAQLGIPTQMVTTELLDNEREFSWSIANIALAVFAKLGGVPWVIDAPEGNDLVIGIGRADVRTQEGIRRIFGYAVTFASNGTYRSTWAFTPAADEDSYLQRLGEAVGGALTASLGLGFERLVIHLSKKTGRQEIRSVRDAINAAKLEVPVAFLRLDDSTIYDIADGGTDNMAPPKGLAVRLSERRVLLQTEGTGPLGPPDGPLLIELDSRSDVHPDALESLTTQAFHLAHANWRGFNARSHPVTLAYGELLARLVGYLEEVETWDPNLLRGELRDRPWFL
jgi:argonaute-like protein implicated in RNA metabolism and viral defense